MSDQENIQNEIAPLTFEQQQEEENKLIAERRQKLQHIRDKQNAFPNNFYRDSFAKSLHDAHTEKTSEALEAESIKVKIAGRIMAKRIMGKASFIHIQDMTGQIQVYIQKQALDEAIYNDFKTWDIGDIVGIEGKLFKTKMGELTVKAENIALLTKSLRPLPDKFHGLTDQEIRYRQRYVDLIMNTETKQTFQKRIAIIQYIRNYLNNKDFMEVETPMLHPIPGGATARPFSTHHNALDMPLYMRIAPELYLKRLVVGGFERVYEINRNFRNEGLSTRHNPEFTMIEFYQAYATYHDLIDLTEDLLRNLAKHILGNLEINYQGEIYDFAKPFKRFTLEEALIHYHEDIHLDNVKDIDFLKEKIIQLKFALPKEVAIGTLQLTLFEETIEHQLKDPTFIMAYPIEVSPLARRNDSNPAVTDRFELFIGGREIANGFSELNDPEDQAERFRKQVAAKEAGDEEAMYYDADYIRALEYGMPPAAGEGIGIDRLVMLLTDSPSIRDVLFFPLMRPE